MRGYMMTKPPDLALGSSWNPQRMFFRLAAGHCFNFLRAINKHRNPDFSSPDADFRMKLSKTAGEPGISLFHLHGTGNRIKLHRKDRKGREIRLRLICHVFSGIRHSLLVPKFCNWRRKNLPFQRSLTQFTVPDGIPETELLYLCQISEEDKSTKAVFTVPYWVYRVIHIHIM